MLSKAVGRRPDGGGVSNHRCKAVGRRPDGGGVSNYSCKAAGRRPDGGGASNHRRYWFLYITPIKAQ